jgi:hypothetical protein
MALIASTSEPNRGPSKMCGLFINHKEMVPPGNMKSQFGGTNHKTVRYEFTELTKREHLWLKGKEYLENLDVDGSTLLILFSGEW